MQRKLLSVLVAGALTVMGASAQAATGASTTVDSYLTPTASSGVSFTSILTVGNLAADNGYKMVGIPDGMGAYDNGNGTFTLLLNHELGNALGTVRAHGATGAFVSEWVINKSDLRVQSGSDLMRNVYQNTGSGWSAVPTSGALGTTNSFARFCSADLAAPGAFYNNSTGLGTQSRIYLTGEESSPGQRGVAIVATGTDKGKAYVLPWANSSANSNWENLLANPYSGNKTIVIGNGDGGTNGLYVYVGDKANSGNEIEKAGLVGGSLYRIAVNGSAAETRATDAGLGLNANGQHTFTLVNGADTTNTASTKFLRPEDGVWDTKNPNVYYFVTTDQMNTGSQVGRSRLWKMTFSDLSKPENGGNIEMLLNGTEGQQMFDNMTMTKDGKLILQEDPGNNAHLAKIWSFDTVSKTLSALGVHDANRFLTGGSAFLTQDEESSGSIDVTELFAGVAGYDTTKYQYFLVTSQAHYGISGELVEGGQISLMAVPVPEPESYAMFLAGLGLMGAVARRRKAAR